MNSINKDELFTQLSHFLKTKGIELQQGSYTRTIEKGCQVLADTINLSQQAVERAKSGVEKKLEQVRQVIHEKTGPKKPPVQTQPPPAETPAGRSKPTAPSARAVPAKRQKRKRTKRPE